MSSEKPHGAEKGNSRRKAFLIFGIVLVIAAIAGFAYWRYAKTHLSTDDAFVEGTIHYVSSRIGGTVTRVRVTDNQAVEAGDLLVELDPDVFEQHLAQEQASLASQQALLEELDARRQAQQTRVVAARAALEHAVARTSELDAALAARAAELRAREVVRDQAETDLRRAENLFKGEVIAKERFDQAKTAFGTAAASAQSAGELKRQAAVAAKAHESAIAEARAAVALEEAALKAAEAGVKTQRENIRKSEADVALAGLDLAYTRITAPGAGRITRKSVEIGNRVKEGEPLMALVSLEDAYVVANYKETRVAAVKPGQHVRIRIDAYPGKDFAGTVDSVMSGTGAVFSLFPPENASGNYVKVVQRIPVKIVFDNIEEVKQYLRLGMSVVPTVFTED